MANVLVIKNANFTTNRVAVITFDGKPCTGIELAESTISVTGDTPVEIEYTVTPSDTTDAIIFESSDQSVATVEDNIVTIVGIGSTTISVTCGSYSDSLTLTADLYEVPDWYGASKFVMGTDSNDRSTVSLTTVNSSTSFNRIVAARASQDSDYPYKPLDSADYSVDDGTRPIKIPNNVGRIHISGSNLQNTGSGNAGVIVIFTYGMESVSYNNTYTVVKAHGYNAVSVSGNAANGSVNVPEGVDSYYMGSVLKTSAEAGSNPETIATSTCDMVIHYLSPTTE